MKICLISFDNWGFNKHIAYYLEKEGHSVRIIDFSKFKYSYPNFLYRLYNGFLKVFLNKNLKTNFYGNKIIEQLQNFNEKQDLILTIKADFISPQKAIEIKEFTHKSIAFFNDGTKRCPNILNVINCFDETYSFDKNDCKKYNLKFKPNFIYSTYEASPPEKYEYDLFNVSSLDKRLNYTINIAKTLKKLNIKYEILILKRNKKIDENNNFIKYISAPISLSEIKNFITKSKGLLDVQRTNQSGLTFRVFESLGYEKKLITTNSDIKNYDFYNPNNISVVNPNKPVIDKDFFNTPYEKIDEKILNKYRIEGWVQEFLT